MKTNMNTRKSSFSIWWIAGIIVIIVAGFFALRPVFSTQTTIPRDVSVAEAVKMRDSGAFILDVRQPEEWEEVHIPGATLIPLGELQSMVNEVPKDQDVVVVCRSGNRSQQGRDILLAAGFTNVTSMEGGMNQWQIAGNPVTSGP
jgi:rhodanese-related sulfurtransferase